MARTVSKGTAATGVLDSLLSFKDHFRKFAVRNWNETVVPGDPIAKRYKVLDDPFPNAGQYLPKGVTERALVAGRPLSLPAEMEALTAKYFRFDVEADSGIQSVEFDFNGITGREHLNVDALIRNVDGWVAKPVSLDGEPKPVFCFDLGPSTETVRGSFVELRLVLSNHGHVASNRVGGNLQVHPSRGGCAGWTGEIRWSNLTDVPGVQRNDVSTVASVTFKVDENPPGASTAGVVPYKVSRGHVTYRAELTMPSCHQVASAQVEMNPDAASGPGATTASLATFSTNGVPQYGSHSGATFGEITVTGNCTPDGSHTTVVHPNQLIPWWSDPTGKQAYDLKENGTLMQEDVSVSNHQGGVRTQWTLRKTRLSTAANTPPFITGGENMLKSRQTVCAGSLLLLASTACANPLGLLFGGGEAQTDAPAAAKRLGDSELGCEHLYAEVQQLQAMVAKSQGDAQAQASSESTKRRVSGLAHSLLGAAPMFGGGSRESMVAQQAAQQVATNHAQQGAQQVQQAQMDAATADSGATTSSICSKRSAARYPISKK